MVSEQTTIRVLLERNSVVLEHILKDIAEIKSTSIPNGKDRMESCEESIESLNRWKFGLAGIVAFVTGLLGVLK